jgi:DNA ligase-1
MRITYSNGIYLADYDYWLDPKRPVERAFISHAHFDHFCEHKVADASGPTAELVAARANLETRFNVRLWREPWVVCDGLEARLYPAGHVLGSAMIYFEGDGGSVLYTGDFKLRGSLTAEEADPPRAEILVMESTYGLGHYLIPPVEKVVGKIVDFCEGALEDGEVPILFAYSLGKTQEVLARLGARVSHPIYLHPQGYAMTQVYARLGIEFPPYYELPVSQGMEGGGVVIAPPQMLGTAWVRKFSRRRTAMITGWALDPGAVYRFGTDEVFAMSDHADYRELLDLVQRVKPRRVFTVHGFAVEFAETLRRDGIEAWALGQENQLDFFDRNRRKYRFSLKLPRERREGGAERPPVDSFLEFAMTAESIGKVRSKRAKVRVLAEYLRRVPLEIVSTVALYFSGRVYPACVAKRLNFSWALMKRAVLEVAECTEQDFREIYKAAGDSATTTELILQGRTRSEVWGMGNVVRWFDHLSTTSGALQKVQVAASAIRTVTPKEAKYLCKLITGDLRLGLKEGLVEEAIAEAFSQPLKRVREAYLLCGDIGQVALAAREDRLAEVSLRVFNPIPFMLATPMPSAARILEEMGRELWVEYKFDGIRCQIHKEGSRVELYSRELRTITDAFGEVAIEVSGASYDFIADGEIVGWNQGRPLPFSQLQRRLGREGSDLFLGSETPVILVLYDCMWWEGRVLLQCELWERKAHLRRLFERGWRTIALCEEQVIQGEEALEFLFNKAREEGHEGLMIKNPRSVYAVGQRGREWLKFKKPYETIDAVVVAAEYGHGKRYGMLSDYTFAVWDDYGQLQPIGKAYSGLTNREIERLTEHFWATAIEQQGNKVIVKPTVVLEIAFNGIAESKRHPSGLALRFPRIVTIRWDKRVEEIDTLRFCRELLGRSSVGGAV